jgi:hypothetical protein
MMQNKIKLLVHNLCYVNKPLEIATDKDGTG